MYLRFGTAPKKRCTQPTGPPENASSVARKWMARPAASDRNIGSQNEEWLDRTSAGSRNGSDGPKVVRTRGRMP